MLLIPDLRTTRVATLAILLTLALPSCTTPDSVAKFCSSAVVTLKTGDSIFDDMKASCLREAQTREPFGAFSIADPNSAVCDEVGKQANGLKAASRLLIDYFTALNDLASFGSSKTGDEAKELFTRVSSQAKLGSAHQSAFGSIASLLTRVATSGYQQKQLADDIVKVHSDVRAALEGLGEAAGVAYLHQLQDEAHKTATRYTEFLLAQKSPPDVVLTLDTRWQNDRTIFGAKENAALCYQTALGTIAKADDELAAHARGLKAKDLPAMLSPYAAQLESMAPAIQKAFF